MDETIFQELLAGIRETNAIRHGEMEAAKMTTLMEPETIIRLLAAT